MITSRTRVIAAPRTEVWTLVGDPYHHPRWWPRVERVERVTARGWTNVMISARGNTVRTDWAVEENAEPVARRWAQEIEGTAFERLFTRNAIEARLEHAGDGTELTLRCEQKPRGLGKVLPFIVKRAMGRTLDEALENLAAAVE